MDKYFEVFKIILADTLAKGHGRSYTEITLAAKDAATEVMSAYAKMSKSNLPEFPDDDYWK